MRDDYYGGLHGDAIVTILREGKYSPIKISDLSPGDYLRVPGDWSWEVEEVRCFKRKLEAFQLNLTSGGSLVLAKGTVLAGLAGRGAPHNKQSKPALFFARQNARKRDSRRAFVVALLGADKASPWLKKKFGSRKLFGGPRTEKHFYYPAQALYFLDRALKEPNRRGEALTAFSGVFGAVTTERDNEPNLKLNIPLDDPFSGPSILPLFAVDEDTRPKIVASADRSYDGRLQFHMVKEIQQISFQGPWYFPIFRQRPVRGREVDLRFMRGLKSIHPWSFCASEVAVFYPDEHLDTGLFHTTGAKTGALLIRPRGRRCLPTLGDFFNSAPSASDGTSLTAARGAQQIVETFAQLKRGGVSEKSLRRALAKIGKRST